jgi:hypothetical protein
MAHISVPAFGTVMNFRVPGDADLSGFNLTSVKSRADVKEQLDDYLRSLGYEPDEYYKW